MVNIEICNLRNTSMQYLYDYRVDRFNKVLGNKFRMFNENERDLVCDKYEEWFNEQIKLKNKNVLNELNNMLEIYKECGKLRLFCWCYPRRCHSETIKRYLENRIKEMEK